MKLKPTIMALLWVFLMYAQHAFAGPPGAHSTHSFYAQPPAAGFTYSASSGCVPVTVQFYSQLNGPSYSWTFGDGGTSSDCNPVHTYTTPGVYTVTLIATGGTYTTTITVGANPVVTFTGDSVSCQNDVKSYTATSTIAPASYTWTAQGGSVTSSTATSANITWSSYGINYVNYTITTPAGCTKIFRYKVKVIPPPMFDLPCCDKREQGTPHENPQRPSAEQGDKDTVKGGAEPCSVCALGYNCYSAAINPEFGTISDYTWNWTITNGTIVSISNDSSRICVTWGASGTGKIKLEMIHKVYGCKSVKECEVLIMPGVTPAFTVSGTCVGSPVNFEASATTPLADVESFYWEFGDGYTETSVSPFTTHTFAFAGSYTATLTITTTAGCTYKTTRTFNIISGTKPKIECPGTVCEGSRQCYTTTSIAGATYNWTITGDIASERVITGNQVCVTWGAGPAGSVTVTVVGGGYTCTNTVTEAVAIVSSVIPISAPDFICATSNYLEVSTVNYAGACYKWSINGVGQASTINTLVFNPSLYANPIVIKVEVDFPVGCCHGSGIKQIRKLPQYTMFTYNYNVCIGSTVTYNLNFPSGAPGVPVSWSAAGGTVVSSTATSVTIKWITAGTGTITAGNNSPSQYCNDGTNNSWNVQVWNPATGDDISGPPVVCAGSSNTYYHAWGSPTGSASISVSPSAGVGIAAGPYSSVITFPSVAVPTNYTISVTYQHTVVNCPSTKNYVVKSIPTAIPLFSGVGGNVCQGDTITYTANVPDTLNYAWSVVGGSIISQTYVGTLLTIKVQWNSTLTSSITMSNRACGTSNSQPVTVNGKPVVIITPSTPACGVSTVTLRVAPVWASYLWSNGGTANTTGISTPGTYSVTVSNGVCSNTGSINVPVVVPAPPVINSFTVNYSSFNVCPKYNTICPNITLGSGTIASYSWSFSGFTASSSSANCPAVALASVPGPSTGTWTLTVTDTYGCTSTLSGSLTDSCIPDTTGTPTCTSVATFSATYNPCSGQFTSSGTNYTGVTWYFGDGTLGGGFNPVHIYSSACNKTVTAYVTDVNGCTKAFTFTIAVPYTFGTLKVEPTNSLCTGASVLTTQGVGICAGSGFTVSYDWYLIPVGGSTPVYSVNTGSSNTLNVGSISPILLPPGDYVDSVKITIGTCVKYVKGTFNKGGLKAYFVSCGGCAGSPLTFTDRSVPYTAPIIKWLWNITGPASFTSSLQNPTINFTVPGTYTVSLTVTDNNPCNNTYTTTINVLPPFVPGNILVNGSSTPSGTTFNICPGTIYNLQAPPGTSVIWSNGSSSPTISVTEPGDYYVTVFNANNCSAKIGPIKILYKPAPEALILAGTSACSARLVRAFTGTGYNYTWNYPVSSTSTGSFIYMFTGGPVTLSVTNTYGCTDTKTQVINVNPSPSMYISSAPTPFCPGSTATLTANVSGGTAPYTYLWNNGSTAPAISVSTPGLYKNEVKDANGCEAKYSLNLQPATPPGMDMLPKGCYDVCGEQVTFCSGMMPWGWNGQWYRGATPYGGIIPQGASLSTVFAGSGSYTLHYIPINPSVSCAAVSSPLMINFIALPVFTISAGSMPPVICIGSTTGIVLSVNIQSPLYNYTWYQGGTVVGSGYTYTATSAGTYTLVISKGACCNKSVSITIEEVNCCFDAPNVPHTPILNDITISSNAFWDGKYYIDAVVTVDGTAILDITNVDCVFGPRGTIVFKERSFLRCNNSVLRPCEKDDIWIGLQFLEESSGWINTTTIKNAIIGVDISGNDMGVRLTDNSFIKCQVGVNLLKSRAQHSISGNTFETDETRLRYPSTPDEYWGIRLYDTEMKGLIAQNNFRLVQQDPKSGTLNYYYGIYAEHSNATISENYFNDMYRSIDVVRSRGVVAIEKNEIKVNYNYFRHRDKYQVRVTDCEMPVLIYENEMNNRIDNSSVEGAIYCENTYRTHIKDNRFNGFMTGIYALKTHNLHITSNTMTSSSNIGISLYEAYDNVTSCNSINSMNVNGNSRYGVMEVYGDGSSSIYSNCIFNMNTAMYFLGIPNYNLPMIYNNYMYNYDQTGIYNQDYSGYIGLPGGATDAGRNTFMSNNGSAGTLDIFSTVSITEDGNFGIINTVNTSTSTGTDRYYSTSACGHQIQQSYNSNLLDRYNICDIYYSDKFMIKSASGSYNFTAYPGDLTSEQINQSIKLKQTEVIGQISAQMEKGENYAASAAEAVLHSDMNRNLAARILITNCLAANDVQRASSLLASAQLSNISKDLRTVLAINIELAVHPVLTSQQRSVLTAIDNLDNEFSPIARDILQAKVGEHDYKFRKVQTPQVTVQKGAMVSRLGNNLSVYPVPASDKISIKHNVNDADVNGLKIFSVTGTEIKTYTYEVQSGVITIDISTLANGMYSVTLVTDNELKPAMTGRFIKIK